MKIGDTISGKLVGFRYIGTEHGKYCLGTVADATTNEQHTVLLGDADTYSFSEMMKLKGQGVVISATLKEVTKDKKERFENVEFGL